MHITLHLNLLCPPGVLVNDVVADAMEVFVELRGVGAASADQDSMGRLQGASRGSILLEHRLDESRINAMLESASPQTDHLVHRPTDQPYLGSCP